MDISDQILRKLEDAPLQREIRPGMVVNIEQPGEYDSEEAKAKALANVHSAFNKHESTVSILTASKIVYMTYFHP